MLTRTVATPAFGQADLSNCERELIHLAGSIQPHGALFLVREPDNAIVQASTNAAGFLGLDGEVIGRTLDAIPGDLAERLRPHLSDGLRDVARGVRCHFGRRHAAFDCLIHRPSDGGLIVELERAGPSVDFSLHLETALQSIMAAATVQAVCDATARIFKTLIGYDRVMVYRFDEQGHGEVFSEEREPGLEAYLGNRYPASDIPQIARRLYVRNRVRVLQDVEYAPVPLTPALSPISGEQLDMSLCLLRSISPIHVQYLKNMGVRATLVVSLMVSGRLWGLISCHHYVPRFVHFEARAVCELLAEAIGTRIAALESFAQVQAELSVRRLEQRMIQAISREGDWRGALFDRSLALLEPVGASGAALLFEGEVRTVGEVPGTATLREIGDWLDRQPRDEQIATASLPEDAPQFAALKPIASGLLAVPVSATPGEYLVWLRPERVRTVTWGGNPFAPHGTGDDPATLSPRRSFAQWHQVVEGTADPWSPADLAAARLIGDSVSRRGGAVPLGPDADRRGSAQPGATPGAAVRTGGGDRQRLGPDPSAQCRLPCAIAARGQAAAGRRRPGAAPGRSGRGAARAARAGGGTTRLAGRGPDGSPRWRVRCRCWSGPTRSSPDRIAAWVSCCCSPT